MIQVSEVAKRYAAALFQTIADKAVSSQILEELRAVQKVLSTTELVKFFESPLVAKRDKAQVVENALIAGSVSKDVTNFITLMTRNGRLEELSGVLTAYQAQTDHAHNVVRGLVRSAAPLGPEQRTAIEKRVTQVTGKKVILEYKEDKSLLGGLVADVGSLTFDDSLETQLRLMNEELKRRSH